MKLGLRAIFFGWFLTILFAFATVWTVHEVDSNFSTSDTLISIYAYGAFLFCILLLNPLLGLLVKVGLPKFIFRPFNRNEVLLILMMCLVTSGISTYGMANYLMPFLGSINNPKWSTPQSDWGVLNQTVLKMKDGSIRYGDLVEKDENSITLKIYGGDGSENEKFSMGEVNQIQAPKINNVLFLTREQSRIFQEGLPLVENAKGELVKQNSYPAFFPSKSDENISGWMKRMQHYRTEGLPDGFTWFGSAPWGDLFAPLKYWFIIIIASYILYFALAQILFKQWSNHEKLQFPLASIPLELIGATNTSEDDKEGKVSLSIWGKPAFLIGFIVAFLIIFYNGFLVDNSEVLKVNFDAITLALNIDQYLKNTGLEGLTKGAIEFRIFFVYLGLALLVPKEVSFSIWFFGIFFFMQVLIAVGAGYGQNFGSFGGGKDFIGGEAFGALAVFSIFAFWKVRHYLLAFVYKILNKVPKGHDSDFINKNWFSSIAFWLSCFLIWAFMLWAGISVIWATFYCLCTLFFIIAAYRVASECGIMGFQNINANGLDILQAAPGVKTLGAESISGLKTIHGVMFFDTKTFMGPNIMVSKKIEDEARIKPSLFWGSILVSIMLAMVFSIIFISWIVYENGAEQMNRWYFTSYPKGQYNGAVSLIKAAINGDAIVEWKPWLSFFMVIGAVVMLSLLLGRTKWFWVPHPVGLLLWISPVETKKIISCFFVGWFLKYVIVKFGDKETIENMKRCAIGLIIGHITALVVLGVLMMILDKFNPSVTLNFNWAG